MGKIAESATKNDLTPAKLEVNGVEIAYKDLSIDNIIDWCKAHGKVEWLKTISQTKVEVKKYPRKKEVKIGKDGKPELTKNGKSVKMVSVADKSQPPVIEKKRITFVQIKKAFAEEFAPDILPVAKSKGLNMYDKLDNL